MRTLSYPGVATGLLWAGILLLSAGADRADITPNPLVTDGMVLQQQSKVSVWGSANAGEKVTVTFRDQTVSTVADGTGFWSVPVQTKAAGGPFPMTLAGTNTIQFSDVYVGEVWLLSGQSNFEFGLEGTTGGPAANAQSDNPLLHLFVVHHTEADTPQSSVPGKWVAASPKTTKGFSAVGYWFGSKLQKKLGIPVGIILSVWGGTDIEAWVSRDVLDRYVSRDTRSDLDKLSAAYQARVTQEAPRKAQYDQQVAAARAAHQPLPPNPHLAEPFRGPSHLYNGMIAPLEKYTIKGIAWYQGESNHGSGEKEEQSYGPLLVDLIRLWRAKWGEGNLPFIICQLADFGKPVPDLDPNLPSSLAAIRDAQFAALSEPNTALVVTIDLSNADGNVHYVNKEPVGDRLMAAALALAYGDKAEYSGPLYQGVKFEDGKAVVSFSHLGGGLVARDGPLTGFTLAGSDGKFFRASAVIDGNTVVVSSPDVPAPAAVRYGWADIPLPPLNLWNKANFPASPFRSDTWVSNGTRSVPPTESSGVAP